MYKPKKYEWVAFLSNGDHLTPEIRRPQPKELTTEEKVAIL